MPVNYEHITLGRCEMHLMSTCFNPVFSSSVYSVNQYFITPCTTDADFTSEPYSSLIFYFELNQALGDTQRF